MDRNDDVKRPMDHLPPEGERDESTGDDNRPYPDAAGEDGGSPVTPETAAEPGRPDPHGVPGNPYRKD